MAKDKDKITTMADKAKEFGAKSAADFLKRMAIATKHKIVDGAATGKPVDAQIDFSRWIGRCECGGAEIIDPDYPYFYCFSCGNKSNKGKLRPVTFPVDYKIIETELLTREDMRWKCWDKSQSIEELKVESAMLKAGK